MSNTIKERSDMNILGTNEASMIYNLLYFAIAINIDVYGYLLNNPYKKGWLCSCPFLVGG